MEGQIGVTASSRPRVPADDCSRLDGGGGGGTEVRVRPPIMSGHNVIQGHRVGQRATAYQCVAGYDHGSVVGITDKYGD